MTLTESFALVSFTLFSFADLRYRLVPGIEIFLFGTILLTLPVTPIQTAIILWLVPGDYSEIFQAGSLCLFCFIHLPGRFCSLAMGIARGLLGALICLQSAALPVSSLCLLFFFPCLGLEVWRRIWIRRQSRFDPSPAWLVAWIACSFFSCVCYSKSP